MKKLTLLLIGIIFSQCISAQVTFENGVFLKDGKTYRINEYKDVLENDEAEKLFKKAKSQGTLATIVGGVGGGLLGGGLGILLFPQKRETINQYGQRVVEKQNSSDGWIFMGIGAGIIGAAIPIANSANKKAKKAIKIENGETSSAFKPHFKLESRGASLALSYNF